MAIKSKFKKTMPERLLAYKNIFFSFFSLSTNYIYDFKRFIKYSLWNNKRGDEKTFQAKILLQTHIIEKGLSLKNPRPGFGKEKIDELLFFLDSYIKKGYCTRNVYFGSAVSVIENYIEFQRQNTINNSWMEEKLKYYKQHIGTEYKHLGGVISLKKEELPDFSQLPFDELFNWRYSLRSFHNSEVDIKKVIEAVHLARKAPSACNRQGGKAYIINDINLRSRVAKLHMGINGFGEQLSTFIIITSDVKCFGGAGERNQAFVDGGLFAMSVLMALHYKGLATIPLHWGVEKKTDAKLHKVVGIPASEAVIMLIGVGNYPDEFNVAKSCRRGMEDVCVII